MVGEESCDSLSRAAVCDLGSLGLPLGLLFSELKRQDLVGGEAADEALSLCVRCKIPDFMMAAEKDVVWRGRIGGVG